MSIWCKPLIKWFPWFIGYGDQAPQLSVEAQCDWYVHLHLPLHSFISKPSPRISCIRSSTSHLLKPGNHLYYGIDIHIETKFTSAEILEQRAVQLAKSGEKRRQELGEALQMIPLLGRIIAHGCVFYWDQLDRYVFLFIYVTKNLWRWFLTFFLSRPYDFL